MFPCARSCRAKSQLIAKAHKGGSSPCWTLQFYFKVQTFNAFLHLQSLPKVRLGWVLDWPRPVSGHLNPTATLHLPAEDCLARYTTFHFQFQKGLIPAIFLLHSSCFKGMVGGWIAIPSYIRFEAKSASLWRQGSSSKHFLTICSSPTCST